MNPFERTKCSCSKCVGCCKRQPGPLAPGDFERIVEHYIKTQNLSPEVAFQTVKAQLWASPGALVKDLRGQTLRVGTITPRFDRRKGACVFLDAEDRCTIHEVAPFGCAMFDTHMSQEQAHIRSSWLATKQRRSAEYQDLRATLGYATHHKPLKYDL